MLVIQNLLLEMCQLTGGHVPGQNSTMTLKRTRSERGNLNARKFATRDLELGPALLKAGKVRGSGGQPLSFSSRIESLPSLLVATRCPAMMSNGPKTQTNSEASFKIAACGRQLVS